LVGNLRQALINLHHEEQVLSSLAMTVFISQSDVRVEHKGNRDQTRAQRYSHHTILLRILIPYAGGTYPRRGDMLHTPRPTIIHLLFKKIAFFYIPNFGSSRNAKRNYVALGFVLESCQPFPQARSNGLVLPYRHWLTGYLTAVNKLTKATVDIRGTTDIAGMLGVLDQYCRKNPLHSFSRAVEALVKELYPKRITHMPQKQERLP